MNFEIGQVIKEGKAIERTGKGWIIKTDTYPELKLCLKTGYFSTTVSINSLLNNLIVVGRDKRKNIFYVALDNYLRVLIDYFYDKNLNPLKDSWEYWLSLWDKECSYNSFESNFSLHPYLNHKGFEIFELRGSNYRLPVCGAGVINIIAGQPLFYPKIFSNASDRSFSVYKTENSQMQFPLKFEGNLEISGKTVVVYFHGFADPFKWHFVIWKHKVGLNVTESAFKEHGCKVANRAFNGNMCDISYCLQNNLYQKVHPKIKNDCVNLLENCVTLFNNSTTINILRQGYADQSKGKRFEIVCRNINMEKSVLPGICYDWDSSSPTLHINPKTIYDYNNQMDTLRDIPDLIDTLKGLKAL